MSCNPCDVPVYQDEFVAEASIQHTIEMDWHRIEARLSQHVLAPFQICPSNVNTRGVTRAVALTAKLNVESHTILGCSIRIEYGAQVERKGLTWNHFRLILSL